MADVVYYYKPRKTTRRKQTSFQLVKALSAFIFISATLLTLIVIALNIFQTSKSSGIVSPLPNKPSKSVLSAFVESVRDAFPTNEKLAQTVSESLDGTQGTYAIAIKNLKTGETYYQNETMVFDSASLYKLWVMGTVYDQEQKGKLDPDKPLHADVQELNETFDIDPDFAELTDGSIDFTVRSAVEQMITISHNYAAMELTETVKVPNMQKFLATYGLKQSKVDSPPRTTAFDTLHFYEQLYNGKIVSPAASAEMLEVLKRQQLNDRIPKYLPESIDIAHKTGELNDVKHDAGIVYSPGGDYIFVVLSKSSNPDQAAERIALLSRAVYDYFNK